MDLYDELTALFEIYEYEEELSEVEIIDRCKKLVVENKFENEFMNTLNDVINNRGYSFQFIVPKSKNKKFSKREFYDVSENATRSSNNTLELINYLKEVQDFRLTLSLLYALKIKHLITLNYLPNNNQYINQYLNSDLQMLYYYSYKDNKEVYELVLDLFEKIGIKYARLDYMEFRLDIEHLLLSILEYGKGKTHLKVNTLKIAFNISPREYLQSRAKSFFEEPENDKVNEYLKIINKEQIKIIKEKWNHRIENLDDTGYKSLYKIL